METNANKSGAFIFSQLGYAKRAGTDRRTSGPAITISQQSGSGAHDIAERVAAILPRTERGGSTEWAVYDRQLVERALEEHRLPKRIAQYMPEDRRSYIQDITEEFLGLRPPSWVLVPQVVETIRQLAKSGHVILVGRGAPLATAGMFGMFHVRLVASPANRIERVAKLYNLTRKEAASLVDKEDRGSRRYALAHFRARIEDESLYHLIINTDRVPYADAATLIADAARRSFANETPPPRLLNRHHWGPFASLLVDPVTER